MPLNHLILCHPLFLQPTIFPSIRLFPWVSYSHQVAKVLEFQLQHQSFQWTPRLISFRMDWLDLLAVQGTLKSLLQHHTSKASILRHSAFFTVQLSHPYMTTGKTTALTRWTFVGKVMSLLLNMLSRLIITFLPRSEHLLISWLQSPFELILEPKKIKVWHCFPIYFPWSDWTKCHDLSFLNGDGGRQISLGLTYAQCVLVSSVQQSDSVIFFSDSFLLLVITKYWVKFPVLYCRLVLLPSYIFETNTAL